MKRRRFIHTTAVILAAGSPLSMRASLPTAALSTLAQTRLLSYLGDHDCICSLGLTYRLKYADENDLFVLAGAIMPANMHADNLSDSYLHDYIDNMIKQDFEQGRTQLLDGWILSRTEARQIALYSMLYS